jgi:MFS family permease
MINVSRFTGATLLTVACLTIMVGCVIVPGLTSISSALGVPELSSWLVTVPSLGVVVFGPFAAKLIHRIGLRNGLRLGLFLYGLLGAGAVFLRGAEMVLADRLLLGGATALVMASGTGLISHFYSGKTRLVMIARQGMSIELGGVIFLFVGGLLATAGWKYPFLLYLFAWVLLVAVEVTVPSLNATSNEVDGSTPTSIRIAQSQWLVFVAALLSMVAFFSAVISLPAHLKAQGASEAQIGYFLSFVSLVAVGGAALMPGIAERHGEIGTLLRAFICYALGHLMFFFADNTALMIVGGVAIGCGFGLSVPLVNHMTIEQTHERNRGTMLAYLSMAIFSGQFLSSLLELFPGGGNSVFLITGILAVCAYLLIDIWHKRLRLGTSHESEKH